MAEDDDAAAAAAAAAADAAEAARLVEEARRADEARRVEETRLRLAALDEYEAAHHEALWAQATAVVNVKSLIPVILDQATNTYTKWRHLFLTVLGKYALTQHVLEDEAFPTRPAWTQADCVVLTWIYGTVSGDLQQSLMLQERTARQAWQFLEDEFLGQRESRALLLKTQFCNFRQDSLSIADYCHGLETMAASLAEFGDPIGDRQMVLTLLCGLSGKFCHMVSILKMHRPYPTFAEARTHLLLEEMEIAAQPALPPTALVAAHIGGAGQGPAPRPGVPAARPPGTPGAPASGQANGGQRNGHHRGCGGRGAPRQQPGSASLKGPCLVLVIE